jgi:hypothetical protein
MLALLFVLNLVISIFNAWSCGRSWAEARIVGGWARFMAWMGATMSAVGFTWCYAVATCFVAGPGGFNTLTPEQIQMVFELAYLAIIFPALGSGIAITVQSWVHFARERNWGNAGVAIWNSYAQVSNAMDAAQYVPGIWAKASKAWGDSKDKDKTLPFVLAAVVCCAGIVTTALIIRMVASARENELRLEAAMARQGVRWPR